MTFRLLAALAVSIVLGFALAASSPAAKSGAKHDRGDGKSSKPLVIAHRGASGYRLEHTLAAYELGARLGADDGPPPCPGTRGRGRRDRSEPCASPEQQPVHSRVPGKRQAG